MLIDVSDTNRLVPIFSPDRLKQLNVLSLTFLPSPNADAFPNPTLVLLSLTPNRTPHLTSYTIDLATKDILADADVSLMPLTAHISDPGANMLVPLPKGGVMVVGEKEVVVYEVELPSLSNGQGKGKGKETVAPGVGKRRRSSVFSSDGGAPGGSGIPTSPTKSKARLSSGSRGVVAKMPAFAEVRA